jgi:hypothetical protein
MPHFLVSSTDTLEPQAFTSLLDSVQMEPAFGSAEPLLGEVGGLFINPEHTLHVWTWLSPLYRSRSAVVTLWMSGTQYEAGPGWKLRKLSILAFKRSQVGVLYIVASVPVRDTEESMTSTRNRRAPTSRARGAGKLNTSQG